MKNIFLLGYHGQHSCQRHRSFFFFVDLKNSTYLFQAQHIKYRKDTLPRTKVLSWWIRCYSTSMVIAALTQFSIFTGLKCFSKPVTDKLVFSTEEVSPSLIHFPKGPTNEWSHSLDYSICDPRGPWTSSPLHPFNKKNRLPPIFTVTEQPALTSQNKSWF